MIIEFIPNPYYFEHKKNWIQKRRSCARHENLSPTQIKPRAI